VAINTVSNWISLGAQIIASLFLVGYVYGHLGKEQFGIYRTAVTFGIFMRYLSFGLEGAVIRLASESVAVCDWRRLSAMLSVVRTLLAVAGVLGLVAIVVLAVFLLGPLNVPDALHESARRLFTLTGLAGGFSLMFLLYRGALQASQRHDLANTGMVAEVLVRVGLIVLCVECGWVRLEVLGVCAACSALIGLVLLAVMVRRVLPRVRMSFRSFTPRAVRDVFSFGAWTAMSMTSRQVLEQAGVPLVGATLGQGAVAVFSLPQLITNSLFRLAAGITNALRPMASAFAVHGEYEKLRRLYRTGARLSIAVVAVAFAPLVTHGKAFIVLWTGPDMAAAYPVMLVCIGLGFLRAVGLPAEHTILAAGRIRGLALTRLATTLLGLGMAAAVVLWGEWGIAGLAGALFLPSAVRGVVLLPLRIRSQIGVPWHTTLLGCAAPPLVAMSVPMVLGVLLGWLWPPTALYEAIGQMVVLALAYLPGAWFGVLSGDERRLIRRALSLRRDADADSRPDPSDAAEIGT